MKHALAALASAATLALAAAAPAAAQGACTIALIPGLTTDAFYITMRKGAEMAAKAAAAPMPQSHPFRSARRKSLPSSRSESDSPST